MEITEDKITEMIAAAAKSGAEEALKSLPPVTPDGGTVKVERDEADQPFPTMGAFFKAVKNATLYPGSIDRKLLAIESKAKATGMSEAVPADGGYLLPPNMAAEIFNKIYVSGSLLDRVAQDPVSAGNSMTYNAVDETSRAEGSRWGGLRGYWLAEGGTITSSKPKFRQVELKLKKVAALCYATDEQLEDTPNLQSWLTRTVPDELRFQIEDAIYQGTGAGKPLGIMNSPALVTHAYREDANKVTVADVMNMYRRRWVGLNDYVWLISQSVLPQLVYLGSTSYVNLFMPAGAIQGQPGNTLLGFPIIETEYNANLGTTGDIVLASLSQYQTITKGGVRAESSIHVQFTTDEMAFRFIYRIDGAPLWDSAITPFNAGSTQSPFVCLTSASV